MTELVNPETNEVTNENQKYKLIQQYLEKKFVCQNNLKEIEFPEEMYPDMNTINNIS